MKDVFEPTATAEIMARIHQLTASVKPLWGKMAVAQMLAHCNVTYELVFENKHPTPNAVKKWFLKTFIKKIVVSETPFKKGSPTGSEFIIKTDKDFEQEKKRLIDYIAKTQQLGKAHFDGKLSHSFGKLSTAEWNNMFYKHLDHHLQQFGV
jgi:hypothetical protein